MSDFCWCSSQMKQAWQCECTTEFANWYMMWEHLLSVLRFYIRSSDHCCYVSKRCSVFAQEKGILIKENLPNQY